MAEAVAKKELPVELNKFNWGAFLLSWIWGIGNKSYLTFWAFSIIILAFIPVVNMFAPLGFAIWFGLKGNEWAWQNKEWESVEKFNEIQKKWTFWGVVVLIASFAISFLITIFMFAGLAAIGGAMR